MATSVSPSFCHFYLNKNIPGHLFLEPSIFVCKSYQWIFSTLIDTGCMAVIEVISRFVYFFILPIIALLASLLIPIGLICKAISSNCLTLLNQKKPLNSTGTPSIVKHPVKSVQEESESSSLNVTPVKPRIKPIVDLSESSSTEDASEPHEMNGEWVVKDNGDCLFESFLTQLLRKRVPEKVIAKERADTVNWINKNYDTHEELQRQLVQSVFEHYMVQLDKLGNEHRILKDTLQNQEILGLATKDIEEVTRQIEVMSKEIERIEKDLMPALIRAGGKAHDSDVHFEEIAAIVKSVYLPEMRKKGVFAGAAELFALSCRYETCVKVHSKTKAIDEKPFPVMNPQFETPEKSAFHFTKTTNHYNPYFI